MNLAVGRSEKTHENNGALCTPVSEVASQSLEESVLPTYRLIRYIQPQLRQAWGIALHAVPSALWQKGVWAVLASLGWLIPC